MFKKCFLKKYQIPFGNARKKLGKKTSILYYLGLISNESFLFHFDDR